MHTYFDQTSHTLNPLSYQSIALPRKLFCIPAPGGGLIFVALGAAQGHDEKHSRHALTFLVRIMFMAHRLCITIGARSDYYCSSVPGKYEAQIENSLWHVNTRRLYAGFHPALMMSPFQGFNAVLFSMNNVYID